MLWLFCYPLHSKAFINIVCLINLYKLLLCSQSIRAVISQILRNRVRLGEKYNVQVNIKIINPSFFPFSPNKVKEKNPNLSQKGLFSNS